MPRASRAAGFVVRSAVAGGQPALDAASAIASRALLADGAARSGHISGGPICAEVHSSDEPVDRARARGCRATWRPSRRARARRRRALDPEVVEQLDDVARRGRRSRTGRAARASRRGRACRSGSAGSARPAPRPAASHIASVVPSELREDERAARPRAGDDVVRDHRCSSARSTSAAAAPVSRGVAEVGAHARGVDLEAFQRRAQPGRGRAGGAAGRTAAPTRVPGAGGALVLLHHRREQGRDQRRAPAARSRARRSRRPGCACAASTTSRRRAASRTSPTSVWASSVMSRAALPTAPGGDAERAGELADPAARGVPGRPARRGRAGARAGDDCAAGADAVERADRAAELRRPAGRCAGGRRRRRAEQPAGGLQAERRRPRLLEQRAPDDRRVAVRSASAPRRRPPRAGPRAAAPARAW